MKRIRFESAHGQSHVDVAQLRLGSSVCAHDGCSVKGGWHDGDVKSLTDEDADLILTNPQFHEVPADEAEPAPAAPTQPSSQSESSYEDEE